MAKPRTKLSEVLHRICGKVYYQPPTGTEICYPCIIYELDRPDVKFADNTSYVVYDQYSIKYITRDPDDNTRYQFMMIEHCSSESPYISENLYHYPFRLYW